MNKLRPRPNRKHPKATWEKLDQYLQDVLSDPTRDSATVNLEKYQMSKEDILSELAQAGYSVIDHEDGFLTVR